MSRSVHERCQNPERKQEESALLKKSGGNLHSRNFDYSEWQRTSSKTVQQPLQSRVQGAATAVPTTKGMVSSPFERPSTEKTTLSGGGRPGTWLSSRKPVRQQEELHTCSRHKHGILRRSRKEPARDEAAERRKAEQIKMLQLRIQARRKSLGEYTKRQGELLEQNMKLRETIEKDEKESHEQVKKLLQKYEKFRGGISTLNDNFRQELADTKKDLEQTRLQTETEMAALQEHVDSVDKVLTDCQNELLLLISYKDKEYPVKSLSISDLEKQTEQLEVEHKEDEAELRHVLESEVEKFHKEQQRIQGEISEKATQEVLAKMHPTLKDMAVQNMVMEKEKDFHIREIAALEKQNLDLKQEVAELLKNPKTNVRQQIFPEFFPMQEKCTPDMEVVLDIPTQEWLPI